jgi:hypothetical protein
MTGGAGAYCTRRREAGIVPRQRTRIVDRAFFLALAIKGIDGALELVGGLLLFVVPPSAITLVFRSLTQHELSEDPHDVVAIHIRAAAEQLAGSASVRGFGVLYLIGHGVIKLVLVGALVRRLRPACRSSSSARSFCTSCTVLSSATRLPCSYSPHSTRVSRRWWSGSTSSCAATSRLGCHGHTVGKGRSMCDGLAGLDHPAKGGTDRRKSPLGALD